MTYYYEDNHPYGIAWDHIMLTMPGNHIDSRFEELHQPQSCASKTIRVRERARRAMQHSTCTHKCARLYALTCARACAHVAVHARTHTHNTHAHIRARVHARERMLLRTRVRKKARATYTCTYI